MKSDNKKEFNIYPDLFFDRTGVLKISKHLSKLLIHRYNTVSLLINYFHD